MLNLDTHILIFFADQALRPDEYRCTIGQELAISDIVLWEIAKLARLRRLKIDLDDPALHFLLSRLTVIPISFEIARTSTQLDFSGDPADEIIAATSVVEKIPLLTRDGKIRRSRMVPLAL